jgi:hypothetical protein
VYGSEEDADAIGAIAASITRTSDQAASGS